MSVTDPTAACFQCSGPLHPPGGRGRWARREALSVAGCLSRSSSCLILALSRGLMKTCSRRGRLLASSPTTRTGSPSRHSIFRYRIVLCQQRWHTHLPVHYPVPGPGFGQETTAPALPQPEARNRDSCVSDFPEVQSPRSPRRPIPWGCWGPGTCSSPRGGAEYTGVRSDVRRRASGRKRAWTAGQRVSALRWGLGGAVLF